MLADDKGFYTSNIPSSAFTPDHYSSESRALDLQSKLKTDLLKCITHGLKKSSEAFAIKQK